MKRFALLLLLALLVSLPLAMQATITPVVEYTSTSTLTDVRPFTLGYSFTTTVTFNINALGVWDDGLGNTRQVGIWDTSGNLLVSTTVLGTDPVTGHFQYASASYMLAPGTYVIGAEFPSNTVGNPFPNLAQGVTSLAGYSWIEDRYSDPIAGLNFPYQTSNGNYGNNGIFYADFSAGSSVPEPSSLLLLGTGLLGAVGAFRRKINL